MSLRGLRNTLGSVVPKWLQNRPGGRNVGFRFLYAMIQPLDVMIEQIDQGIAAAWPGLGTPTALPLIGQSRGIGRGETETDASYAKRLIPWIDTWTNAGGDATLAAQIQGYLGTTPMVRVVNRAGFWVTVAADGTVSTTTAPWDWDSHSHPARNDPALPWWSDVWIIIYPTEWAEAGTIGATADPSHDVEGVGHLVPREAVDAILAIVAEWKGAHAFVQAIIWSYDVTLFDPASPVAGDPDGWWGNWGKTDPGTGALVPSRNPNARYWTPPQGV